MDEKCKETVISSENLKEVWPMTATRREAIELLEQVPEDKLVYIVQI